MSRARIVLAVSPTWGTEMFEVLARHVASIVSATNDIDRIDHYTWSVDTFTNDWWMRRDGETVTVTSRYPILPSGEESIRKSILKFPGVLEVAQ